MYKTFSLIRKFVAKIDKRLAILDFVPQIVDFSVNELEEGGLVLEDETNLYSQNPQVFHL